MQEKVWYGIGGLLLGAAAVWLLSAQGTAGVASWPGGRGILSGPGMMGNQMMAGTMDAHFIEQMIPHHEDAITMANLALARSQRPEIRQLAQAIIDSQSAEIEQMRNWYRDWYGRELPAGDQVMQRHGMMSGGGLHMGMMGNETDLGRLEAAADFDRAFIEEMIPHHQMAVMMASMLNAGTERAEMRELADNIITAQTNEIDQMRQWYAAWY